MEKLKSPSFQFYSSDFMTGTTFMTNEEVGAYIRCLCMQHQKGHLKEKEMQQICLNQEVLESVMNHYKQDDEGLFYNERLDFEKEKREKFIQSRSNNRTKSDSTNTCIYLMIDKINNMVKIGNSNNPERRLIEVKNYYKNNNIILYAYCSNVSQKIEKELHDIYKDKWCYDEWYRLTDDDISQIISTYHMIIHMNSHITNHMINHMENEDEEEDINKEYIINYYINNINTNISSIEYSKLEEYINIFSNDLRIIVYGIEYCKMYKAYSINYLCRILNNWNKAGYKTLEDIKLNERKIAEEKENKQPIEVFDTDWLNED